MIVLDVDQLEVPIHEGGAQEYRRASVDNHEVGKDRVVLPVVQVDGDVLDGAGDGGLLGAVGTLKGDGLRREEC